MRGPGGSGSVGGAGLLHLRAVPAGFRTDPAQALEVLAPLRSPGEDRVVLRCARGESACFHLLLSAAGSTVAGVHLEADPFSGPAPWPADEAIQFFRVWPVEVGRLPTWHLRRVAPQRRRTSVPDVLIPASAPRLGQPYRVAAGQPLHAWVELNVPGTAVPGTYRTTVRARTAGGAAASLELEVQVADLDLPVDLPVALLAPVDVAALLAHHLGVSPGELQAGAAELRPAEDLIAATARLLRAHHLDPVPRRLYPRLAPAAGGGLEVDWAVYDALAAALMDGASAPSPVRTWEAPFDAEFPPRNAPGAPADDAALRLYLTHCAAHFQQRGWPERAYIPAALDGTAPAEALPAVRRIAGAVAQAGIPLPLAAGLPPQDLRPYGWYGYPFTDLTDRIAIWAPAAQFYDVRALAASRAGRWMALDRPPYSGTIELAGGDGDVRVIPLQAAALDARAVLLPEVNHWGPPQGGAADFERIIQQNPAPLLLPGRSCGLDAPLTTLRLKMLRQGMQDLAYLELCRRRGLHAEASALQYGLCTYAGSAASGAHFADGRFAGWITNPDVWNLARNMASCAVLDGARPALGWVRFREAAAGPRLERGTARVRMQPSGSGGPPRHALDIHLQVANPTPASLAATAEFGALPAGWTAGSAVSQTVPAGGVQVLTLQASAAALDLGVNGRVDVPVVIEAAGQTLEGSAPLAHLTVRPLQHAVDIDGDLSDWPLGIGNLARGFVPLAAGAAPRPASHDTVVMVASDDQALYFAFNCFTPRRPRSGAGLYDDRLARGGELVEILLDPAQSGAHSPAELYHIIIRPGGECVLERGIGAYPPVGRTEPWAAEVQVAVRESARSWVAELRIARSAFGAGQGGVWGVNFCRFDEAEQVYSTWAGAVWDAYNPATLGNMSLIEPPAADMIQVR